MGVLRRSQNTTAGGNYAIVGYRASGAISSLLLGNGAAQAFTWNDRVQPTEVAVTGSPAAGSPSLLKLDFYPCASQATTCTSGNNGNLQAQKITVPGMSSSLVQSYSYDHLNRLTQAQETGGSGWTQGYGYDAQGNRWVTTNTNLPTLTSETPQSSSWYSSTIPNRIAGWSYDSNGNLLGPAGVAKSYTYDAENRQVTANMNGTVSNYSYDGNGLRVSRVVGSQITIYVYDAWGNLAAEYPNWADTSSCDTPTCYAIEDHLGSTRLLTDASGSGNVARYDYQPFGQELLAGIGSRTTGEGYQSAPDGMSPKFTGQQRDQDTGLDWYQVRHMSGAQGRFQSPDPANAGADAGDPQTWNGYSYVGNNPLSFVDPSGTQEAADDGGGDGGGWGGLVLAGLVAIGDGIVDLFGGAGGPPTASMELWSQSEPTTWSSPSSASDSVGFGAVPPFALGFQGSGAGRTPPRGYMACPAVPFVVTGVGPRPQAPGNGAFTGRPPRVGQVAIEPKNFGIPYDTLAERQAALSRPIASVVRRIIIYPNFGTNTAPLPRGTPQVPAGLPSRGPYSPADAISPRPTGNQIDLYRYGTMQSGRASTRITMPTIFIPINNVGVRCPQ